MLRLPQIGQRIRLTLMKNDPDPVEPGAEGVVDWVNDLGDFAQIGVRWDDGRRLMLALPEDDWEPA